MLLSYDNSVRELFGQSSRRLVAGWSVGSKIWRRIWISRLLSERWFCEYIFDFTSIIFVPLVWSTPPPPLRTNYPIPSTPNLSCLAKPSHPYILTLFTWGSFLWLSAPHPSLISLSLSLFNTHTHTQTHSHIYQFTWYEREISEFILARRSGIRRLLHLSEGWKL